MKEAVKKSGMLSMGLGLLTAGYALFQAGEHWIGLASIVVGLLLVFSSQTMHVERGEIEELKREVSELKK
jgi:CHASE2 domain-containing sensor protein